MIKCDIKDDVSDICSMCDITMMIKCDIEDYFKTYFDRYIIDMIMTKRNRYCENPTKFQDVYDANRWSNG